MTIVPAVDVFTLSWTGPGWFLWPFFLAVPMGSIGLGLLLIERRRLAKSYGDSVALRVVQSGTTIAASGSALWVITFVFGGLMSSS